MRHDILPNSCRICLKAEKGFISVYKPLENGNKTPSEMLQEIAGIVLEEVYEHPSLPKNICKICIPSLTQAFRFRSKILESQQIISNHLLKECENAVLRAKQELDEEEIVTDEEFQYFTEPKQVEPEMPLCGNVVMEKGERVKNMILDVKVEEECVEENSSNVESTMWNIVDADYVDKINVSSSITDSLNLNENDSIAKVQKIAASEKACDICSKSFAECSCMLEHRLQHDTESGHTLTICDDRFKKPKELFLHTKIHHDPRRYVCNVCNKSFTTSGNLQNHIDIHTGIKNHHCKLCNVDFLHRRDLTRHEKTKRHQKLVKSAKIIGLEIEKFEGGHNCSICGKSFPERISLRKHFRQHGPIFRYTCTKCDKRFKHLWEMKRHETAHSNHRPFVCNICDKALKSLRSLQAHIAVHRC